MTHGAKNGGPFSELMGPSRGASIRQIAYCDIENPYCDTPGIFISVYYWP